MYECIERNEHQIEQLNYIQDSKIEQPVAKKPKQPNVAPPAYLLNPKSEWKKDIPMPEVV